MTDKEICQRAFLLILLSEIAEVGVKNGIGIERIQNLRKLCIERLEKKITGSEKDIKKLFRRCNRAVHEIFVLIMDKQTKEVNTHKLVLALHPVAYAMKEAKLLDKDVEELIEAFLEIEGNQTETFDGKPITDEDWLKLKASADKRVEDILEIIKNI